MAIATIIGAALAAATPVAEPLAPAVTGMVQCHEPNAEKKTCVAISTFTSRPDGGFTNVAETLLIPDPAIVMRTVVPVRIVSGAVCGRVEQATLDAATFTVNGAAMPDADAVQLRQMMAPSLAEIAGRELCTSYSQDGAAMVGQVKVDGVDKPEMVRRFRWVAPGDGYKVAP